MKLIQKHSIILSGFAIFILFGYSALQNFNSPQSGEMKTDIKTISTVSQSGIETDSIKRLKTYSESGTAWNMSPFGSGKPLEEEKKPVFKKPNTEWKTRTLSGITYVFGEGNPKEVTTKLEDLDGYARHSGYVDGVTVRSNTEKLLAQFLVNPMLVTILNQCGPLTRSRTGIDTGLEMGLPDILFTTDFSMESMITIDPSTGQKQLDREKFGLFGVVFSEIRDQEEGYTKKRLINKLATECLSGDEIIKFDLLVDQYNAIQHSWYNGSGENRKEVCKFLELKECNPVSDQ